MLSRFGKLSHSEIRKAIIEMNDNVLSVENLNALTGFVPTPEEIELLAEYDGDKSLLGIPEKFYLEIMTIPRLEERLKANVSKRNFTTKIAAIRDSLEIISSALTQLKTCAKLQAIFEIILAVGNYLNGGTTRGGAFGFKLEALGKLADLKASSGGTLLNYVVRLADAKGISNFVDDLKSVNDASKETLQGVLTDLSKLKADLNLIKNEGHNEAHNAPGDKFRSVMTAYVQQATKEYDAAEKLGKETEDNYNALCKFFVEDPKNDSLQFFEFFSRFISLWDKARKENAKPAGKK